MGTRDRLLPGPLDIHSFMALYQPKRNLVCPRRPSPTKPLLLPLPQLRRRPDQPPSRDVFSHARVPLEGWRETFNLSRTIVTKCSRELNENAHSGPPLNWFIDGTIIVTCAIGEVREAVTSSPAASQPMRTVVSIQVSWWDKSWDCAVPK